MPATTPIPSGAVVLLSGGQDSTTCFAWARDQWQPWDVHPLIINYGQRHVVELECARRVCELFHSEPPKELTLEALTQLGGAALTDPSIEVSADARGTDNMFAAVHGLPSTFVPGRNLLFLGLAAAYAAQRGVYNIVTGVCETDRAGYPDCRGEFIEAAEEAVGEALGLPEFRIHAPLLTLTKAKTFELAHELGVLGTIIQATSTCYYGDRSQRHEWGTGCGKCPACAERERGWNEYQLEVTSG